MRESRPNAWGRNFKGWHSDSKPGSHDGAYHREHTWTFQRTTHNWELELPVSVYEYCTNRARTQEYMQYLADPLQDPFIDPLIERFEQLFEELGLSRREQLDAVSQFVQAFDYSRDIQDTGHEIYPKYPIETINHGKGDCEDGTILLGILLQRLGYSVATVLLRHRKHILLGVDFPEASGGHIEVDGTEYYFIETTDTAWKIGEIPRQYQNAKAQVEVYDGAPVLVHEWTATPTNGNRIEVDCHLANFGNQPAKHISVNIYFETRSEEKVTRRTIARDLTLHPSDSEAVSHELTVPADRTLRGVCEIGISQQLHDRSQSAWRPE